MNMGVGSASAIFDPTPMAEVIAQPSKEQRPYFTLPTETRGYSLKAACGGDRVTVDWKCTGSSGSTAFHH